MWMGCCRPKHRGINHMEYLFQSIVGATLHAEVVNDKQRIAAKAGNILIPACKAGREVAQDNGEVRHIYGDFFLHEGVCDTARKVAFPVADVPPEQAADVFGLHFFPMLRIPPGNPGLRVSAVVVLECPLLHG